MTAAHGPIDHSEGIYPERAPEVDGPHSFGTPVRLPEPFGPELDTSGL
ncbi:hypothetical protein ACFV7Q_00505 [Streptomyces sp. NPDC059851]